MKYTKTKDVLLGNALDVFKNGSEEEITRTLIDVATSPENDRKSVETWCLHFARSDSLTVAKAAVISLGHLARIHRAISVDSVCPVLETLRKTDDRGLAGIVEDAEDDIRMFCSDGGNSNPVEP